MVAEVHQRAHDEGRPTDRPFVRFVPTNCSFAHLTTNEEALALKTRVGVVRKFSLLDP